MLFSVLVFKVALKDSFKVAIIKVEVEVKAINLATIIKVKAINLILSLLIF
jgi:hypothetical protein